MNSWHSHQLPLALLFAVVSFILAWQLHAAEPSPSKLPPTLFPVKIADPAFPDAPPRTLKVAQTRDQNGFPTGYSVGISTEVCMDKKCRIVEVTLYWNAAGSFDHLEYPPDKPLTKKEHEPFTAEDYSKLDRILKDRGSILARQSLAFLAKSKDGKESSEIDAWSGATPMTVKESVVEHAAYTTWVLWQWVNGPLVQKLCEFTGKSCTPAYLKHLLRSADRSCVDFALKFLTKHHPQDDQYTDDVLHVLENGDRDHILLSLRFLKGATKNKEELYAHLIRCACHMSPVNSPVVLDFLAGEPELPPATLGDLTSYLNQLPYFQVHLILRILEQQKFCSAKTESDLVRLLAGDDFFVARRACEFLANQKLSREAERKVREFSERNRDRM